MVWQLILFIIWFIFAIGVIGVGAIATTVSTKSRCILEDGTHNIWIHRVFAILAFVGILLFFTAMLFIPKRMTMVYNKPAAVLLAIFTGFGFFFIIIFAITELAIFEWLCAVCVVASASTAFIALVAKEKPTQKLHLKFNYSLVCHIFVK